MYETPITSVEDLIAQVVEAAARVCDMADFSELFHQSMIHYCEACVVADGKNFELLKQYTHNVK